VRGKIFLPIREANLEKGGGKSETGGNNERKKDRKAEGEYGVQTRSIKDHAEKNRTRGRRP